MDPEVITSIVTLIGAVGSSSVGVYFDHLRRKRKREEPTLVQKVTAEALSEAIASSPAPVAQESADTTVAVATELQEEVIATEVAKAVENVMIKLQKKADQTAQRIGFFYFLAGVLATIAITLWVHP